MVGDNDFCSEMCYYKDPEVVLEKHKRDLLSVLRILKVNLPRTIVNIIPPIRKFNFSLNKFFKSFIFYNLN